MIAPTYAEFIALYPEFTSISSPAVSAILVRESTLLSETNWDKFWYHAICLMTAHRLALRFNISSAVSAAGMRSPLSSIQTVNNRSASPDSLSESSATSSLITGENAFNADLARTEYGLEFLSLMQTVISPVDVIVSSDITGR
jgi:hypothetical protein